MLMNVLVEQMTVMQMLPVLTLLVASHAHVMLATQDLVKPAPVSSSQLVFDYQRNRTLPITYKTVSIVKM